MENNTLRLLIPWDFTPVAENAIKYAVKIGSLQTASTVELIHVIESGGLFTKGTCCLFEGAIGQCELSEQEGNDYGWGG